MDALIMDIWTAVKDRYELAIQNGGMLGMCFSEMPKLANTDEGHFLLSSAL